MDKMDAAMDKRRDVKGTTMNVALNNRRDVMRQYNGRSNGLYKGCYNKPWYLYQ